MPMQYLDLTAGILALCLTFGVGWSLSPSLGKRLEIPMDSRSRVSGPWFCKRLA